MLTRQLLSEQIGGQLAILKTKIAIMNRQGSFDTNIYAQDVLCRLFNAAFDYKLINLNKELITVAGIDLGDKENRIAIQVTSENTSTKVKDTIRIFREKELYKDYDRIIIALLSDKKKHRTIFDTKGLFNFDKKKDIISLEDFASLVSDCTLEKQEKVLDILCEELRSETAIGLPSGKKNIELIEGEVFARCRSKLISAGLTDDVAKTIIENDINSDKFTDIVEAEKEGRIYLQGEFGSGKSHALYILILRMIREYNIDKSKPLPLYATADEISRAGGVQKWKEMQKIENLADSYYLFIDGCDEMSIEEAEKVIDEVQYLRALWTDVHFLLCGRPLYSLIRPEKIYCISCLSEDQMAELISLISEKERDEISRRLYSIEKDIKETLRRPFFTLIYSVLIKQAGILFQPSYSGLISQFVDYSLGKSGVNKQDMFTTLEQIAILSVDRNIGKVHISEIKDKNVYDAVQKTGFLFLHRDNAVSFPLPIFAQWFASEGVLHKQISIDEILDDDMRSSRWRYAFSLMFSRMTFDESLDLFSKIVKKDTGNVARIIQNGTINEYVESNVTSLECGEKIRKCMEIWADSFGTIKNFILPYKNNKLMKLAIDVEGFTVTTTWADKPNVDDVCVMSLRDQILWGSEIESRAVRSQATWPWIYTFETIQRKLRNLIKDKTLLCDNDDICKEFVWKTTLSLLNKGDLYQEPIPLEQIEEYRQFRKDVLIIGRKKYKLDTFFSIIDQMYCNNECVIQPTVPIGDKEFGKGRYVWSHYSEQRMLERVTAIYQKALEAYSDYISSCFSSIASRMRMAVIMPVVFHANLSFKENGTERSSGPAVTWHVEALPFNNQNSTDITLNEPENLSENIEAMRPVLIKDVMNRPKQREWIGYSLHSQIFNCVGATPITDVVFQWIEEDLNRIRWI